MRMALVEWARRHSAVFWILVAAAIILPRLLLQTAVPVYLFSDDSHSYLLSAFHWTQTGDWETSPRRGALYSMLIAGTLRVAQNLNFLTIVQHFLGAGAVAAGIAIFRRLFPQCPFWLALLISISYALSGFPIFFEQQVRSEILLLLLSTAALGSWALYVNSKKNAWLWPAGIAFGLATLIKNLLLPFPLVIAIFLMLDRAKSWKTRLASLGIFATAASLPFLGNTAIELVSGNRPEAAPQSGILLYGRVAQWTMLDSDRQPEIKKLIRADIESYRGLPRLNNNIILKRTAVPRIASWLRDRKGSRADLNRICRGLALEAISANLGAWTRQIASDLGRLHWKMNLLNQAPGPEELEDAFNSTSKIKHQSPLLRQAEVMARLSDPITVKALRPYHIVTTGAWLFSWHAVLLTTLCLPVLLTLDAGRRPFWIMAASIWYFNVLIICTVGRPIPRYLAACLPLMFFTLGGSVLLFWTWLASFWQFRHRSTTLEKSPRTSFPPS